MSIRKPFEKRDRVSLKFDSPSMAKQSFKNECDINNIVKRYHTTGMISHISRSKPFYGDFIDSLEYRTALDKIREADALLTLCRLLFGQSLRMILLLFRILSKS